MYCRCCQPGGEDVWFKKHWEKVALPQRAQANGEASSALSMLQKLLTPRAREAAAKAAASQAGGSGAERPDQSQAVLAPASLSSPRDRPATSALESATASHAAPSSACDSSWLGQSGERHTAESTAQASPLQQQTLGGPLAPPRSPMPSRTHAQHVVASPATAAAAAALVPASPATMKAASALIPASPATAMAAAALVPASPATAMAAAALVPASPASQLTALLSHAEAENMQPGAANAAAERIDHTRVRPGISGPFAQSVRKGFVQCTGLHLTASQRQQLQEYARAATQKLRETPPSAFGGTGPQLAAGAAEQPAPRAADETQVAKGQMSLGGGSVRPPVLLQETPRGEATATSTDDEMAPPERLMPSPKTRPAKRPAAKPVKAPKAAKAPKPAPKAAKAPKPAPKATKSSKATPRPAKSKGKGGAKDKKAEKRTKDGSKRLSRDQSRIAGEVIDMHFDVETNWSAAEQDLIVKEINSRIKKQVGAAHATYTRQNLHSWRRNKTYKMMCMQRDFNPPSW